MELTNAIYFYFMVVFSVIILTYKNSLKMRASIVLGLIIGQIVLNIIKMPSDLTKDGAILSSSTLIYYTIQWLTPVISFIILLFYLCKDRVIK